MFHFRNKKAPLKGAAKETFSKRTADGATQRHTYYTQNLCHEIYAEESLEISLEIVQKTCMTMLQMNAPVYLQYQNMLTSDQWNYLIAIAKEGSVSQITANKFLTTHKIGSAAASRHLAKALCEKELLLDVALNGKTAYSVYDVYFICPAGSKKNIECFHLKKRNRFHGLITR